MAQVLYCDICTLPIEFCSFTKTLPKCKKWLQSTHPAIYDSLYESGETNASSSLSAEKEQKIEESLAKMQLKEQRKQERALKSLQNEKIQIRRIPRTKHKAVCVVGNLGVLNTAVPSDGQPSEPVDLKKLAKRMASKFATGASVDNKTDEIVIQGDVGPGVEELLQGVLKEKGLLGVVGIEHVLEKNFLKPVKKQPK
ncbi:Tma22 protein [Martiniozyma asiatica (nom. inval.)]|nr:Tma22 protein [Martiniozyma asiatica]